MPFRVVDQRAGIDIDVSIRCFGEYSYRIVNPILFYTNVCGNVENEYTRDALEGQMRTEMMTALQPAFARISEMGIRYSALPGHTTELAEALNQELSGKWSKLRGIEIVSLGVSGVKASEEDEQMIKELQRSAAFIGSDPRRRPHGGRTGFGYAGSGFQYLRRPGHGLYGHESGRCCRRHHAQASTRWAHSSLPLLLPPQPSRRLAAGAVPAARPATSASSAPPAASPAPKQAGCAAAAHTIPANSARSAVSPARRPSARTAAGPLPTRPTRPSSCPECRQAFRSLKGELRYGRKHHELPMPGLYRPAAVRQRQRKALL